MANMELIDETLDWLIEHPERHYQGSFVGEAEYNDKMMEYNFCETTFCLAGAALMLKNRLVFDKKNGRVHTDSDVSIEFLAQELLELNYWQRDAIFYSGDFDSPVKFKDYVLAVLDHEHTQECGEGSAYYDCTLLRDWNR